MKRNELEHAITNLTRLLRKGENREKAFQRFFERNPIVLEVLGYIAAHPRPRLPNLDRGRKEPDFLVKRADGLFEIFELKTPQERLIVEKKDRDKLSAKVNTYVSQVAYYSEYFDDEHNRARVKHELGLDVQKKPDMILVAGRDAGVDKKLLHLLVRRATGALRIVTYDDVLSMLQQQHATLFGNPGDLSGTSWHAIVTLQWFDLGRRQYVFDAGNSLSRDRWSVYFDERGRLTFEIIESDGSAHAVSVAPGTNDFKLGFRHYICCEFGSSDNFSTMQIFVDNRIADRRERSVPLRISTRMDFRRNIIGADLEQKNHGTYDMAGLVIYTQALSFRQRCDVAEAIFEEFLTPLDLERLEAMSGYRPPVLPNTAAHLIIGELRDLE